MFDFKFNWDETINTGIEIIDTQHKELFRIGRALEQLAITKCIGMDENYLLQIICDLREYVAYHFYEEEHLMELNHYSKLKAHKEEHKMYQDMITNLDLRRFNIDPYGEVIKLKDDVIQLVFHHMLTTDQEMAKELKAKKLIT